MLNRRNNLYQTYVRRLFAIILASFALLTFSAKAFGVLHWIEESLHEKTEQSHCCQHEQDEKKDDHEKHHHDCCTACHTPIALPFTDVALHNSGNIKKIFSAEENMSPPEDPVFSQDIPPIIAA